MALKTRVWGAGKVLVIAGALVTTYVVFAAGAMRLALMAREVQVPDFSNRTSADVTALATDLGLAVRVDENLRLDPKIPAGRVVAQEPPAGTVTRRQRSIRVWLSAGPRVARMPPLGGESLRTATLRLSQDGLVPTVAEIRSALYPSDVVIGQDPPASAVAAQAALLVNGAQAEETFVMPDFVGINAERAAATLRAHGLLATTVASAASGSAAGIIVRQTPQAGQQIGSGTPLSFEVSR